MRKPRLRVYTYAALKRKLNAMNRTKKPETPAPTPEPDQDANPLPGGRLRKSESVVNLARALARAQAELANPKLDSSADTGRYVYRYASLAGLRDAVTPVFTRHGLSIIQSAGTGQRGPLITTLLLHVSGEWYESDPLEIPVSKNDAQGYGSAITYGRRYALQALANVVGDDDDDAQQAVAPARPARQPRPQAAANAPAQPEQSWQAKMLEFEAKLVSEGRCKPGDLVKHIAAAGQKLGYPASFGEWNENQVSLASAQTADFAQSRPRKVG